MTRPHDYDEERLAQLLKMLPPAPEGWVRAAQELPQARREIDEIAERAQRDAEFRAAVEADLESAAVEHHETEVEEDDHDDGTKTGGS